jgi:hypothetical protein
MQANDLLFCASSALNRGGRVGMSVDGGGLNRSTQHFILEEKDGV